MMGGSGISGEMGVLVGSMPDHDCSLLEGWLTVSRSPADITARLDRLIKDIREKWHRPVMEGENVGEGKKGDVLIVAHGHILRAFAQRWAGKELHDGPTFLLEAGGVGTLRYVLRADFALGTCERSAEKRQL